MPNITRVDLFLNIKQKEDESNITFRQIKYEISFLGRFLNFDYISL